MGNKNASEIGDFTQLSNWYEKRLEHQMWDVVWADILPIAPCYDRHDGWHLDKSTQNFAHQPLGV